MELKEIKNKKVYVVVSQTGTVLSRILKRITGAEYNHASVSLERSLRPMYSFGRKYPRNPFWGAFVTESPDYGTFKRFGNTIVKVLELSVTEAQYEAMRARLEDMCANRRKYHYNYRGLFLGYINKNCKRKTHYYCSEFVGEFLETYGAVPAGYFGKIIKPIEFLDLPESRIVYEGKLQDYPVPPSGESQKPFLPNDCGVLV